MPPMYSVDGGYCIHCCANRSRRRRTPNGPRSLPTGSPAGSRGRVRVPGGRMANVYERAGFLVQKTDKGGPVMVKGQPKTDDVTPWQPARTRSTRLHADTRTGTSVLRNTSAKSGLPPCLRRASAGAACGLNHVHSVVIALALSPCPVEGCPGVSSGAATQ